jgi:drug/metabolite transporter (DMT)-like permease
MPTMPSMLLVVLGSLLAAAGQIFLKLGATGATTFTDYVNPRLGIGFGLYAIGSVLWVIALSRLPLSRVYPFTVLTFVIVYVASFALLGERISGTVVAGALLVLAGLVVIATA